MKYFYYYTIILPFTITFPDFSLAQLENNYPLKLSDVSNIDTTKIIKTYDFPQVDIIGRKPELINRIPGSADIITEAS